MESCTSKDAVAAVPEASRRLPAAVRELLKRAVALSILFGITHFLGFRQFASVLFEGPSAPLAERIGFLVYLFLYGSFVIIVPILTIAAFLLYVWEALRQRRSGHAG